MTKHTITKQGTVNPKSDSVPVNALKCQFLTDMELAGMNPVSRKRYLYVVVHSLHYGQGKSVVLNYLARYVFRIAITNNRITSMDQTHVTIRYKDRKGGRWLTSRIEGSEFIRRFLPHVLPRGFHKVRYYGIWHKSNAHHVSTLANSMIVAAIMSGRPIRQSENEDPHVTDKTLKCPHCGSDQLIWLEQLPRPRSRSP